TQTCCGQPGYNSGERASAIALARKVALEFADCEYVVVPSGSCAGMMRTHYPDLLDDVPEGEREALRALSARTYELTDFLVNVAHFAPKAKTSLKSITYHDSCAGLRELGVKQQPRALLAQVAGVQLQEMDECEQCCGFGGTFALKFGDISSHIAERKCENIAANGAEAVVLGDLGCMLNIEGRLRRRGDAHTQVVHVAEVLAGKTAD
ncbi:MAG: (Fe-S)-binding protein, partial [Betaproteobacteria bacterium]|nr:(Fe-S)-binding protein [Betaproteobacteria bacterium]